ncbi:hypothetical protein [Arthrobacter sp. NtRootA1]|uniref:hypothetical protein n=1 Tax=Micrococcaceae TaxID=1268 RepID=UPI001CC650E7|nr:hypothetical protein [Arthrobacter sp. NtRootA1]BCW06231.1 hypothetical protein NtRootA1_23690 [Arthrobacter sp. NtRootA1]
MTQATFPPTPGDRLIFENDRVRVWSMTIPANGMFDYHQHFHDHVILWPEAGHVQGQELGDDDWSLEQVAQPGYVAFKTVGSSGPLVPHRVRSLDDHPTTHYIVELISEKSPSETDLPTVSNDLGNVTDLRNRY